MRAQPKIQKIVNFIVAQTDCGVFVINVILYLSINVSKLGKIHDKKLWFLYYSSLLSCTIFFIW